MFTSTKQHFTRNLSFDCQCYLKRSLSKDGVRPFAMRVENVFFVLRLQALTWYYAHTCLFILRLQRLPARLIPAKRSLTLSQEMGIAGDLQAIGVPGDDLSV